MKIQGFDVIVAERMKSIPPWHVAAFDDEARLVACVSSETGVGENAVRAALGKNVRLTFFPSLPHIDIISHIVI